CTLLAMAQIVLGRVFRSVGFLHHFLFDPASGGDLLGLLDASFLIRRRCLSHFAGWRSHFNDAVGFVVSTTGLVVSTGLTVSGGLGVATGPAPGWIRVPPGCVPGTTVGVPGALVGDPDTPGRIPGVPGCPREVGVFAGGFFDFSFGLSCSAARAPASSARKTRRRAAESQ